MALQTSGPISLNDIHIEAGGTTGTQASTNDADIRGLISRASGTTMSFSDWYGASSFALYWGWVLEPNQTSNYMDSGFSYTVDVIVGPEFDGVTAGPFLYNSGTTGEDPRYGLYTKTLAKHRNSTSTFRPDTESFQRIDPSDMSVAQQLDHDIKFVTDRDYTTIYAVTKRGLHLYNQYTKELLQVEIFINTSGGFSASANTTKRFYHNPNADDTTPSTSNEYLKIGLSYYDPSASNNRIWINMQGPANYLTGLASLTSDGIDAGFNQSPYSRSMKGASSDQTVSKYTHNIGMLDRTDSTPSRIIIPDPANYNSSMSSTTYHTKLTWLNISDTANADAIPSVSKSMNVPHKTYNSDDNDWQYDEDWILHDFVQLSNGDIITSCYVNGIKQANNLFSWFDSSGDLKAFTYSTYIFPFKLVVTKNDYVYAYRASDLWQQNWGDGMITESTSTNNPAGILTRLNRRTTSGVDHLEFGGEWELQVNSHPNTGTQWGVGNWEKPYFFPERHRNIDKDYFVLTYRYMSAAAEASGNATEAAQTMSAGNVWGYFMFPNNLDDLTTSSSWTYVGGTYNVTAHKLRYRRYTTSTATTQLANGNNYTKVTSSTIASTIGSNNQPITGGNRGFYNGSGTEFTLAGSSTRYRVNGFVDADTLHEAVTPTAKQTGDY